MCHRPSGIIQTKTFRVALTYRFRSVKFLDNRIGANMRITQSLKCHQSFKTISVLLFLLLSLWSTTGWSVDFSAQGPHSFEVHPIPQTVTGINGGRLIVPDGPGPYPLVSVSHGWSASSDTMLGWGKLFASYGFVVLVPSYPNPINPDNKKDCQALLEIMELYQYPDEQSPAYGKVDPDLMALVCHSGGCTWAADTATKLNPQALVFFDPVNSEDIALRAAPHICSPLLTIQANPGACNNQLAWNKIKPLLTCPQTTFSVVDSSHCDGENPPRALCGPFCGGAARPARQKHYGHYAVAHLLSIFYQNEEAKTELEMNSLSANEALANQVIVDAPACQGGGDNDPTDTDSVTEDTAEEKDTETNIDSDSANGDNTDTSSATEDVPQKQASSGKGSCFAAESLGLRQASLLSLLRLIGW